MRISQELWKPAVETAIYLVVLYKHLTPEQDRSFFDHGIEAMVYVMPVAIIYGIVNRRYKAMKRKG